MALLLFTLSSVAFAGREWMNWVMYGVALVSFPMLVAFQEKYKRLVIDRQAGAAGASIRTDSTGS